MVAKIELNIMKLFSRSLQELENRGITVVELTDFDEAEDRMRMIGKSEFTPMLSTEFYDFSQDDAVWLILQSEGRDVAGVAARRDNIYSEGLAEFWVRSYKRLYRNVAGVTSHTHAPAAAQDIRGRIVYMGEFYFSPAFRGSRNNLTCFTHLLFSFCVLRWNPDWLYAFVRGRDVRRGYASVYGFTHQIPGAQIWSNPPPGRQNNEYLVTVSRRDLSHMAAVYESNPDMLMGEDSLSKVE